MGADGAGVPGPGTVPGGQRRVFPLLHFVRQQSDGGVPVSQGHGAGQRGAQDMCEAGAEESVQKGWREEGEGDHFSRGRGSGELRFIPPSKCISDLARDKGD